MAFAKALFDAGKPVAAIPVDLRDAHEPSGMTAICAQRAFSETRCSSVLGRFRPSGGRSNRAPSVRFYPLVQEVEASMPRCLAPDERKKFHLHNAAPRWCYARNLWPYLDYGPPEIPGSSPPYGPPPMTRDEKLVALWDRVTGWFAGSAAQARNGINWP
jgi:hypothetical protein